MPPFGAKWKAEEREFHDSLPAITRCGKPGCDWSWEGPAGEGRERFAAHNRLSHALGGQVAAEPDVEQLETSGDPDLDEIRDILGHGQEVEIRLPREPEPWRREWIEQLGGRIVIDPAAPMPIALQNDRKDGPMNGDEGRSALDAMDAGEAQRPERSAMTNGKQAPQWTRESIIAVLQQFAREHDGRTPTQREMRKENGLPSHVILRRVFGSQNAAISAAGLQIRKRGGRGDRRPAATPDAKPDTSSAVEPEPAPLPVPVAPPEPVHGFSDTTNEKVDAFELIASVATEERISYYEELAIRAQAKAQALRQIQEALELARVGDA